MAEFVVIHRALNNWHKICQVRNYYDLQFERDTKHILDPLPWPLPEFHSFVPWCLAQPGFLLPYVQLVGKAPKPYLEIFQPKGNETKQMGSLVQDPLHPKNGGEEEEDK
jgi:hypothetical protein